MKLNTYIYFNGQCAEALKFYEKCLDAKIAIMMTYAGSPAEGHVPPDFVNKVLHARLEIGDQVLMASDAPPGHYKTPGGFSVAVHVNDTALAERTFNALADGGQITMPLAETFWAVRFGMLIDRFGIPWMVNCEKST
jgi:PhnB protein